MRVIKLMIVASTLAAISLTSGVNESFAGVPTAAGIAPALAVGTDSSAVEHVWWRGYGWRGGGWRGGGWRGGGWGWHRGWGWRRPWGWRGYGYGWGGPAVYGGCWRSRWTAWGWQRVWVC
jgi:hypothetical protein